MFKECDKYGIYNYSNNSCYIKRNFRILFGYNLKKKKKKITENKELDEKIKSILII